MSSHPTTEALGDPDLGIVGLQIWIHGWQYPDAEDVDDGNWLRITAHCEAPGASVFVSGAILQIGDILRWGEQAALLRECKTDAAALDPLEPYLSVLIDSRDQAGHLRLRVELTPDHLSQRHVFEFEIDQSYLSALISRCERIGQKFPPRASTDS